MEAPVIHGFTGSEYGMTPAQRKHVGLLIATMCDELHHGDCIGADVEAGEIALALGKRVVVHPPENASKRAFGNYTVAMAPLPYLVRNHAIVDASEWLIAAPAERTEIQRSGVWATVRYARKQGRTIAIVYPDGMVMVS